MCVNRCKLWISNISGLVNLIIAGHMLIMYIRTTHKPLHLNVGKCAYIYKGNSQEIPQGWTQLCFPSVEILSAHTIHTHIHIHTHSQRIHRVTLQRLFTHKAHIKQICAQISVNL